MLNTLICFQTYACKLRNCPRFVTSLHINLRQRSTHAGSKDELNDTRRTHEQSTSHFDKSLNPNRRSREGRPWTREEDDLLRRAIRLHRNDWVKVAAMVGGGRTNRGCRQRWNFSLNDEIVNKPFTWAEERRIKALNEQYPRQWTRIAQHLDGRTAPQVREIVENRLNTSRKSSKWTNEEDARLVTSVEKHGAGMWSAIAANIPGRSDAQCYERWAFCVDPNLRVGPWSASEDEELIDCVTRLEQSGEPFHFGHVAEIMDNGRHRKSCRQRYVRLMRKKAR